MPGEEQDVSWDFADRFVIPAMVGVCVLSTALLVGALVVITRGIVIPGAWLAWVIGRRAMEWLDA